MTEYGTGRYKQKGEEYSDGECWKLYNPHRGQWIARNPMTDDILMAVTKRELKELIIKYPHGVF